MRNSIITGSGSFIPENEVDNMEFVENSFYQNDGSKIHSDNHQVIEKFREITGISARRYVNEEQSASEIGSIAARRAIEASGTDPESIDMIVVAHNFGDVIDSSQQTDIIPSLASRIKHKLGIGSPFCVPYDIIFGCPGWLQGLIQAHIHIKAGEAKKCLVVGTETLSRVVDPFDRDTMIFADGAGAVILEAVEEEEKRGIISHATVSHTEEEVNYLNLGKSFNKFSRDENFYIKMQGRKIYEYALNKVPEAMFACLQKSKVKIQDLKKILLHQANEKMDEAIVKRFFRKFGMREGPKEVLPMIIERLGNSSVATVPTLYDLIVRGELNDHRIERGNHIMMASVGAGMNINAAVYLA